MFDLDPSLPYPSVHHAHHLMVDLGGPDWSQSVSYRQGHLQTPSKHWLFVSLAQSFTAIMCLCHELDSSWICCGKAGRAQLDVWPQKHQCQDGMYKIERLTSASDFLPSWPGIVHAYCLT